MSTTGLPAANVAKWRTLQRHPLSAEYEDIEGPDFDRLCADLKTFGNVTRRPVVLFEKQVIDGWQLYRAHLKIDQKPLFAALPKRVEADKFVEIVNDNRRHESEAAAQRRIAKRVERVAALRAQGESTRAIAEEVGVSQAQVRKDLEVATEHGCSVGPEGNTVVGKDRKKRTAQKPSRNGEEAFDTRKFNEFLGHAIRELDKLAAAHQLIDGRGKSHSHEHQGLVRRVKEIVAEVAAWQKSLKKAAKKTA